MTTASTRPADPLAHRCVTENSPAPWPHARTSPRPCNPPPPSNAPQAAARRSRSKRWNDALAEMFAVQAECAAWFEALPESLRDSPTATALQDIIDLDLDAVAAVQPPLGY